MKNHGGAVKDNAETLSEVPILCDPNSPNLILELEFWNWNWKPEINFLQLLLQHLLVYQPFPNLALTEEVIIFHVADSSCNSLVFQVLGTLAPCGVVTKDYGEDTLFPLSRQRPGGLKIVTITVS